MPRGGWFLSSLRRQASVVSLVIGMTRLVDDHGAGEDENIVLAVRDVDAVRVAKRDPLLRHRCDHAVTSPKAVLVIEQIPFGFEIVRAGDVDDEAVMQEREELARD